MSSIDLNGLREAVEAGRYVTTAHAKQRMGLRKITDADAQTVIATGDLAEEYPDAKPFPKCLLMAHVGGEPLYVACAFGDRYAYIITVHRYDADVWLDPWTRKR